MEIVDIAYLAGLVDGEGCFAVRKVHKYFTPCFTMKLRIDDKPLLFYLQTLTRVGHVTRVSSKSRRVSGKKECDTATWQVSGKQCQILVHLFRSYPLKGQKKQDFDLWAESVEHYVSGNSAILEKYWLLLKNGRCMRAKEAMGVSLGLDQEIAAERQIQETVAQLLPKTIKLL